MIISIIIKVFVMAMIDRKKRKNKEIESARGSRRNKECLETCALRAGLCPQM